MRVSGRPIIKLKAYKSQKQEFIREHIKTMNPKGRESFSGIRANFMLENGIKGCNMVRGYGLTPEEIATKENGNAEKHAAKEY